MGSGGGGSDGARRLAAIVFTDFVGYTALTQRSEPTALRLLAECQAIQRAEFSRAGGREVKSTGDGFLIEFPSALAAVEAALRIQAVLAARNASASNGEMIRLRIGVHVGDVVERENDIYGDGVNIASRLEPLARGGGICISATVLTQVQNKVEASFEKLHTAPEGIVLPLAAYRVVQRDRSNGVSIRKQKYRGVVRLSLALVVLLALSWQIIGYWSARKDTLNGVPTSSLHRRTDSFSIGVLPFVNLGADKNDEYLSDGLTEELLNGLAKIKGLRVPGRTSCFAFKGRTGEDIFREAGRALNVQAVLEGSVRRAGDQMRITAQLISVADGYHLWSETYDRTVKDVLAVQNDVAVKVVRALSTELGFAASETAIDWPTRNPEAYRLYLLGRHHSETNTLDGSKKAVDLYKRALRLDPRFALAYCGLADDFAQYMEDPAKWRGVIKDYVETALEIDPNLPEALLSLAMIQAYDEWKSKKAEEAFLRAIELNPNYVRGHSNYGTFLHLHGRLDEALRQCQRAADLDPLSPMILNDLGVAKYFARDYRGAIAIGQQVTEIDPRYPPIHSVIGWSHLKLGNVDAAIKAFRLRRNLLDSSTAMCDLACAYAAGGRRKEALAIVRDLESKRDKVFVYPSELALVYAYLGMADRAFETLESAIATRDWGCFNLWSNPTWDVVRLDPRSKEVMRRLKRMCAISF